MVIAKQYLVRGTVQGVGFRSFAVKVARQNDLSGFVRNLKDGSLEIIIEGNEWAVKLFEEVIRKGSPLARVDEIRVEVRKPVGDLREFKIIV